MRFDEAIALQLQSASTLDLQPALDEFIAKVQRDISAELEVTWDHALVVGWPENQLAVTRDDLHTWLSATDGYHEVYRLVEVWIDVEDGQMALSVKRTATMPMPVPKFKPAPVYYGEASVYTRGGIEGQCKQLVNRKTKPTLPEVRPLIEAFYKLEGNGAGGSLHIVLDDNNVQLPHVQWCAEQAEAKGDTTGMWLARVLCRLSASQRRRM